MNIIRNDKLIKRNRRLGQIFTFASLIVFVASYLVIFRYQEYIFFVTAGLLIIVFPLMQIGLYFTNRWGRTPRLDELLDKALKGLDKRYSLYHYTSPVSHLLLGPSGIWLLLPYYQRGTIRFEKGRWRQHGGGRFYWYLKLFAQEGLGRPELEAQAEMERMKKFYKKNFPDQEIPPINAALVFTHENAQIEYPENEEPPVEAVHSKKLKDLIRKAAKTKDISIEQIQALQDLLPPGE